MKLTLTLAAAAFALAITNGAMAQTATGGNIGAMQMSSMAEQMNAGSFGSPVVSSSHQVAGGQLSYQTSTLGNPANVLTNTVQGAGSMNTFAKGYSINGGAGQSAAQSFFKAGNMTNPASFDGFRLIGQ